MKRLNSLKTQIKKINKANLKIAYEINRAESLVQQKPNIEGEIRKLENYYRENKKTDLLKFNSDYKELLKRKKKIIKIETSDFISNQKRSIRINNKIKSRITSKQKQEREKNAENRRENLIKNQALVQPKIEGEKNDELNSIANKTQKQNSLKRKAVLDFECDLEWKDLSFGDGYIAMKIKNKFFKKYSEIASASLNSIKPYYRFKKIPKLKIHLYSNNKLKIINESVLFFHINMLRSAGNLFGNNFNISFNSMLNNFQLSYYNKHLKHLFHTKSLKHLCQICHPKLPIYPIPEIIISSNQKPEIHDSFIFQVESGNKIYLIWESTIEKKATYIFLRQKSNIHLLFNYMTGENSNKRLTLIQNEEIKAHLSFVDRVVHNYYADWKKRIEYVLKSH